MNATGHGTNDNNGWGWHEDAAGERPWRALLPKIGVGVGLGLVVLGAGVYGLGASWVPGEDLIAPGVTVGGVDVGGKKVDEARELVRELARRKLGSPIFIQAGKHAHKASGQYLGATIDTEAAIERAHAVGRSGKETVMDRLRSRFVSVPAEEVPLDVVLTPKTAEAKMERLRAAVRVEPVNARAKFTGGSLKVSNARAGRALDAAATTERITAALNDPEFAASLAQTVTAEPQYKAWAMKARGVKVNAVVMDEAPAVSDVSGKDINAVLASFSTSLGSSSRNRVHNIQQSCSRIHGLILPPGGEFSYNQVVGPRGASEGYKMAPVIEQGQLVPGMAGGICQVSSTLYNAALLSDLKIVRRAHHAFPVSYVPAGRDATVAYGSIDFQFRNSTAWPIALEVGVQGGRVNVKIHGNAAAKKKVSLVSSGAYRNRSGGTSVTISRVVEEPGGTKRQEVVTRDYYRPQVSAVPRRPRVARRRRRDTDGTTASTRTPATAVTISTTPQ